MKIQGNMNKQLIIALSVAFLFGFGFSTILHRVSFFDYLTSETQIIQDDQFGEQETFGMGNEPKEFDDHKKLLEDDEVESEEELEIEKESGECSSLRAKHPGMAHSMRFQFIHIPKTGGTSVQAGIEDWVKDNPRISLFLLNANEVHGSSFECPPHIYDHTLLIGHRGWGFCEGIEKNGRGLFTATVLRGAVHRMVSLYDFNLFKRSTGKAQKFFGGDANRYTLRDLIKQYNKTKEIEKGEKVLRYSGSQQVRFMCGYECMGPNAFINDTFTPEYMLKRALANLKKTDCVATTNKLNDLIYQLKFHIKYVPNRFLSWPSQNRLPQELRSILDDEAEQILRDWGWADEMLFREAAKIADEKTRRAVKCLRKWGRKKADD